METGYLKISNWRRKTLFERGLITRAELNQIYDEIIEALDMQGYRKSWDFLAPFFLTRNQHEC